MYGKKKTKNSGHTDPRKWNNNNNNIINYTDLFVRVSRRIYTRITATTMLEWCDLVKSNRTEIVFIYNDGQLMYKGYTITI
jgi:hypothetical protein